jgi:hypothetical protein
MIRENSELTQFVTQHIQEHLTLYRTEDPILMKMNGKPSANELSPQAMIPNELDPMFGQIPAPESVAPIPAAGQMEGLGLAPMNDGNATSNVI